MFLDPSSFSYLLIQLGGERLNTFVNLVLLVAFVQGTIACIMTHGRLVWAGFRDGWLPEPVNGWLAYVHPKLKTPVVAFLTLTALDILASFSSSMVGLVVAQFAAMVFYTSAVAIAAFVVRYRKDAPDRFMMPWWPLWPIIAIVSLVAMLSGQSLRDVLLSPIIMGVAAAYYLIYLRPRRDTKWRLLDPPEPEETIGTATAVVTGTEQPVMAD
jgi:amino acid transporter